MIVMISFQLKPSMSSITESQMEDTSIDTPASEPVKISFGVKKKVDTFVVKAASESVAALAVAEHSDDDDEEEEARAAKRRKLTHFEDGTAPEDETDMKKKATVVIPMVMEVDWRVQKLLEQEKDGSITEADKARLELLVETNPALKAQREQEATNGEAIVVDVNKVDTEDADYNKMSIESFGLAILRGCGWNDGDGIGKNPQKVPLRLLERRPKGLGLGAAPKNDKNTSKKNDNGEEVSQDIKTGSLIKITQGMHNGLYAKVESRDDDNSSLFARLALGGKSVRVSLFAVYAVSQKEFDKEGKCINKASYDKEKEQIDKRNAKFEGKEKNGNEKRERRDRGKERERDNDRRRDDDTEVWCRQDCVVKIVSEDYKKGRYMDEKMRVVDVADRRNITLEDNGGKTHYQMKASWLQTVMPRQSGEKVMIVRGPFKGERAVMEEKDRRNEILHLRLLRTQQMAQVSFDDACLWKPQIVNIEDDEY